MWVRADERHELFLFRRERATKRSALCFTVDAAEPGSATGTKAASRHSRRAGGQLRVNILCAWAGCFDEHHAVVSSREQHAIRRQEFPSLCDAPATKLADSCAYVINIMVQVSLHVRMVRCCRNHASSECCAAEHVPVMCGSRVPGSLKTPCGLTGRSASINRWVRWSNLHVRRQRKGLSRQQCAYQSANVSVAAR